jgi:transcriptional regulator with XRE-family HTH domain
MEHRRIPNSLKKYRRISGLSQKTVAAFLGMQQTYLISRWEKGVCLPNMENLFRLSLLYKTPPNNLYFELWQRLKLDAIAKEQKLLAHKESQIIK